MGLRYSPLHVTEFCGEMQSKFKVGLARLMNTWRVPSASEGRAAKYESLVTWSFRS